MGLFKRIKERQQLGKERLENLSKIRKEERQRATAEKLGASIRRKREERKAFLEEKQKVAVERARERARRPGFGTQLLAGLEKVSRPKPVKRVTVRKRKKKKRKKTRTVAPKSNFDRLYPGGRLF